MRAWHRAAVLGLALGAAAAGCDSSGPARRRGGETAVTLTPATYADFDRAVRENKGSVVLVDFWASWCGPCVHAFPHVVALHEKYADFGLACISVSLDEQNHRGGRDAALKFLTDRRATFANFLWPDPAGDGGEFVSRYRYQGGIPHTVVFARDGKLVWNSADEPLADAGLDRLIRDQLDRK